MTDLTKLKIGSKVLYSYRKSINSTKGLKKEMSLIPVECEVVYFFKAFEIPKTKKVVKYYGEMVINPKYSRIFGPMDHDRFVLKRGKDDYIVLHVDKRTFNYINLEVISY